MLATPIFFTIDILSLHVVPLQRSYRRTFNDYRNFLSFFCCRNNPRWTPVLPCTCQAHWATCGQIEFVRYCSYSEQNGIPGWGMSRGSRWLSLQCNVPLSVTFFVVWLIRNHAEIPRVCWQDTWGTRWYFWRERKVCISFIFSFKQLSDQFLFWIILKGILSLIMLRMAVALEVLSLRVCVSDLSYYGSILPILF